MGKDTIKQSTPVKSNESVFGLHIKLKIQFKLPLLQIVIKSSTILGKKARGTAAPAEVPNTGLDSASIWISLLKIPMFTYLPWGIIKYRGKRSSPISTSGLTVTQFIHQILNRESLSASFVHIPFRSLRWTVNVPHGNIWRCFT